MTLFRPLCRVSTAALIVAALPVVFAVAGCKHGPEPIANILNNPDKYTDRDVRVAGQVVRIFDPSSGLLNFAAYQLQDDTGHIWVVTHAGAPPVGADVGVKARVRKDFTLGSDLLGAVLNEEERRTR